MNNNKRENLLEKRLGLKFRISNDYYNNWDTFRMGFESLWVKIFSCLNNDSPNRSQIKTSTNIWSKLIHFFLPSCNCSRFIYARIFFEITRVVCSIGSRMNWFETIFKTMILTLTITCIYLYAFVYACIPQWNSAANFLVYCDAIHWLRP